jgi:hypothetical protein
MLAAFVVSVVAEAASPDILLVEIAAEEFKSALTIAPSAIFAEVIVPSAIKVLSSTVSAGFGPIKGIYVLLFNLMLFPLLKV